jgi:hypothetical protein
MLAVQMMAVATMKEAVIPGVKRTTPDRAMKERNQRFFH